MSRDSFRPVNQPFGQPPHALSQVEWLVLLYHFTQPKCQVASITKPNAMRYQANTLKLWPLTYRINARTANAALTKDAMDPTPMTARSLNSRECRALKSSRTVAPNIVGMPR